MREGAASRTRPVPLLMVAAVIAGAVLTGGCALTHGQPPATQELTLQYPPPHLEGIHLVDAAIKIARFTALSPFDETTMYTRSDSYRMDSFNYYRWVTNPGDQVTDLLYRDFAAAHAFREVLPFLSAEQARFQLEGTVVEFLMVGEAGTWKARLVLGATLIDSQAQDSVRRVLLQRQFTADQALQGDAAEQYVAGMSSAMERVSGELVRAARDAVARRLAETTASSRAAPG